MAKIKVYVVEDMAIPRMSLESMLLNNGYQLSGSSATAETALKDLQKNKTDLILTDINLAGKENGIWLAQQVKKNFNIPIIFLTAYSDQQTLKEVITIEPDGYLMKPYQEPVLLTTIQIAITKFKDRNKQNSISAPAVELDEFIFIKDRFKKVKLFFKDIYYIKSEGNYLEVFLKEKKHVIRNKLQDFKEHLSKDIFIQSHQRYLVNIHRVEAIAKDFIIVNDENIPISQKYKQEVEEWFSSL